MRRHYLLIALSVFLLDRLTKWLVQIKFSPETNLPVIPGLFSLVWVENRGIAFGLFGGMSSALLFGLIVLVSGAALGLVCYMLWKSDPAAIRLRTALAFILGGAGGNLVDRAFRGSVLDFLDIYLGSYHWPAFNIADSAIVVGGGLLMLDLFAGRLGNFNSDTVPSPKADAPTEPQP